MKNIQIIDGAMNCAYDIFEASDDEFTAIFGDSGADVMFSDEISETGLEALDNVWERLINKKKAVGIHGTLFYELESKKKFYPNRKDSDLSESNARAYPV